MTNEVKFYDTVTGISLAILALYLGQAFWTYFLFSFGTMFSLLIIPVMLGYLYIILGLVSFKKWALSIFSTIVILTIFVEILFIFIEKSQEELLEGFFHIFVWVSLVAIPVFGILALISKKKENREKR